jgi:mRNA interferase MazF
VDAAVSSAGTARAEQLRSVSVDRLGPALGHLPADVMDRLDAALRLHLAL